MHKASLSWTTDGGWRSAEPLPAASDLVIYFGSREALGNPRVYDELRSLCPKAVLTGCSTGGQIIDDDVEDDRVAALAMSFERTKVRQAALHAKDYPNSFDAGAELARQLKGDDLTTVFLLVDGLRVNGTALIEGLKSVLGTSVSLHGGLAGDGALFQRTLVGANDQPRSGMLCAIGFYGAHIHIGHGSEGGWSVFGPRRRITRAKDNILFELDGQPALDLYERYLGDEAAGLPSSGLLFPLHIIDPNNPDNSLVRTVLAVDHEKRSLTFAGDMPEGWAAQLMRGSIDQLTQGATDAAVSARLPQQEGAESGVAFLVSCIGRRLLMGQRTIDEVQAVRDALGNHVPILGFYSYGEISPHGKSGFSELHNQTMTIMTLREMAA